jgi:hypothetical protein
VAKDRDPRMDRLTKMFDEAKNVKELVAKERLWDEAGGLIRGKQLPPNHPAYKPEAILNLMRPIINRKISMLTDTKPRFGVQPTRRGDGYAKAAKLLDDTANAWWDDQGLDMAIVRAITYAETFGVCITQTAWSPSEQEVILTVVDPRNFYVDPYILTPEQLSDAEYVILEETPPLEQVKLRFGAAANDLTPWLPPSASGTEGGGFVARTMKKLSGPHAARNTKTAVPRALLRHYWVKDYSFEDVEVTKDGKTFTVRQQKYPGGRYIVWGHDNVILHDKPNPYYDGIHPFDMMDWYIDLDSPWGDSEVCAMRSPQMLLNKLAELIAENAMLMNNAIWVCDSSAFPNSEDDVSGWGQLTNAAGRVIRKRPGTEIKREYPGGIPGSTMQMLTFLQQFIEHTGGTPDVLSKGKAGNVQSGLGIEALQMNAAAPIRLSARVLENLIQRIGQKYISRVIQFYPAERVFHIASKEDKLFQEFIWVRDQFRKALDSASLRDAHRDFRFRVSPGSSLSLTKIQRGLMAVQLYQMGCVDRQAVLEAVEWPDRVEVLERTIKEQLLGLEPGMQQGKKGKGKKGPAERQAKIAGRG